MNVPTPVRFLRKTLAAVAIALAVWAGVAAAQTIEGDLQIVARLPQGNAFDLAWSPDGRYLAADGAGGYAVWDVYAGTKVREFRDRMFAESGRALAFAPDGEHLILSANVTQATRVSGRAGPRLALGCRCDAVFRHRRVGAGARQALRWWVAAPALVIAAFDYAENSAVAAMLAAGPAGLSPELVERASRWTVWKSNLTAVVMTAVLVLLVWRGVVWFRGRA